MFPPNGELVVIRKNICAPGQQPDTTPRNGFPLTKKEVRTTTVFNIFTPAALRRKTKKNVEDITGFGT